MTANHNPNAAEIIKRRDKIATDYGAQKGWPKDKSAWTFGQISEVRGLTEWQEVPYAIAKEQVTAKMRDEVDQEMEGKVQEYPQKDDEPKA